MSLTAAPDLSEALLSLCERAQRGLSQTSIMSGWGDCSATSLASLERLTEELKRAQRPLTILLLGGTGVGKSTLLNALAGEEISSASDGRRAFTSALHIYHHREATLEHLAELPEGVRVSHSSTQLIDKVIIDAPDIDSTEQAHHELVWQSLPAVDVILYVTTWQKYRNRVINQSLARHLGRYHMLCVLNQVDELSEAERVEVSEDLSAALVELGLTASHVLPVSALSARRAQGGEEVDPEALRGFEELNRLLREELTLGEVRRLTELSATRAALRSVALLPQRLAWEGGYEGEIRRLTEALELLQRGASELRRASLASARALSAELQRATSAALQLSRYDGARGPYGLYLSVRRWLTQHGYGHTAELGSVVEGRAEGWLNELEASVSRLTAQLSALSRGGAWSAAALKALRLEGDERRQLSEALSAHLAAPRAAQAQPPRSELELNAWPWSAVALVSYWLLARMISGPEPGLVSLVFGVGLVYGACAAQEWALSELDRRARVVDHERARRLESLIDQLGPFTGLSSLEAQLTASRDQLTGLLTICAELAKLHNQMNEMMRASRAERSELLGALYASVMNHS